MEKLTVLQLSKRTGLSRTQIYYLERQNKINIINGKIDLEEAMPAIIELLDKKSNKGSETNFKQILNLLISQNIYLQEQLERAKNHEKNLNDELAYYRKILNEKLSLIEKKILRTDSINEVPITNAPSLLESSQINEMVFTQAEDKKKSALELTDKLAKLIFINQSEE
ncbi:hypothetical protein ACT4U9_11860 [Acinetobacter baumannii]|uniref:hypothetical protein n=1 Tax=Acinetobacter calcoaceticus/baumannii complex TaxID=909768 RepID=UPI00040EFBD5|nr:MULTISPECIES: hypothetical protein [Acinetobacter calcoaceticus/baumannii complex]EXE40725.1 hypothetical protein J573_0226 [Acinetobacter baumannii 1546444]MDC4501883.1 hypothetical protein [Acinetobacter baumannii]MDC4523603.1 hypothetical protein [Acinetobacter baumannii]MDC4599641.1 hypothetical protein [Acinetobacter baumannii]MDC4747387.1 hypothetical protein [Acinetobacter baumannii]